MLPRGTTKLAAATFGAWMVLFAVIGARAAGVPLPQATVIAAASVALATSVALAFQIVTHAWRGPVVVDFRRDEAVLCGPAEAEVVRSAALLRGTMGGAGYVRRARLAFSATASVSAAIAAGWTVLDPTLVSVPAWPFAVLALLAGAAVVFPARPFYYREAKEGFLLLHPEDAWVLLARFSNARRPRMRWSYRRLFSTVPDARGSVATPLPDEALPTAVEPCRNTSVAASQGESDS